LNKRNNVLEKGRPTPFSRQVLDWHCLVAAKTSSGKVPFWFYLKSGEPAS